MRIFKTWHFSTFLDIFNISLRVRVNDTRKLNIYKYFATFLHISQHFLTFLDIYQHFSKDCGQKLAHLLSFNPFWDPFFTENHIQIAEKLFEIQRNVTKQKNGGKWGKVPANGGKRGKVPALDHEYPQDFSWKNVFLRKFWLRKTLR